MMEAVGENTRPASGRRPQDRLAAAFLLALMAVGCAVTWVAVPVACMWLAGELTDNFGTHFVIALPASVLGIVVSVMGLLRINRLYLRVTLGPTMGLDDDDLDQEERRWMRGPLEPMLIVTLVLAVIALFGWFFFIAENPSRQVL
jgi:hypothetical protein